MYKQAIQTFVLITTLSLFVGCSQNSSPAPSTVSLEDQRLEIEVNSPSDEQNGDNDKFTLVELDNIENSKSIVILNNEGGKTLAISGIKSISNTPSLFKLKNHCTDSLPAGGSCKLEVEFIGKDKGSYEQLITVVSNDLISPISLIKVKVEAEDKIVAELTKSAKSNDILPMLELDFNKLDTVKYIDIKNIGHETLAFNGLSLGGMNPKSFRVYDTCPKSLKVDDSCKITIHYNPSLIKGESVAKLKVLTNGKVSPSKKIRLSGYSEPYTLKVKSYVVSNNVKEYMGDYFRQNNNYFMRVIYQSEIDSGLKRSIESRLVKNLKSNKFNKISSSSKATRIISLYPNIKISEDSPGNLNISIGIHGFYASKGSYNSPTLVNGAKQVVVNQTTEQVNFTSIDSIKKFYDKEPFSFLISIEVTGYEDKEDVYDRIADILSKKVINVLGIRSY